jgi:hypothetical protein
MNIENGRRSKKMNQTTRSLLPHVSREGDQSSHTGTSVESFAEKSNENSSSEGQAHHEILARVKGVLAFSGAKEVKYAPIANKKGKERVVVADSHDGKTQIFVCAQSNALIDLVEITWMNDDVEGRLSYSNLRGLSPEFLSVHWENTKGSSPREKLWDEIINSYGEPLSVERLTEISELLGNARINPSMTSEAAQEMVMRYGPARVVESDTSLSTFDKQALPSGIEKKTAI